MDKIAPTKIYCKKRKTIYCKQKDLLTTFRKDVLNKKKKKKETPTNKYIYTYIHTRHYITHTVGE